MIAPLLIAFGANLPSASGTPLETLQAVVAALPSYGLSVVKCSHWYKTPAMTPDEQPDFVNGVAQIESDLDAETLLDLLHRIETDFGRERRVRWGERAVDIDLIDFRGEVIVPRSVPKTAPGEEWTSRPLALPHPELVHRGFVLLPLAEICPNWCHPQTGEKVLELVAALPVKASEGIYQVKP